MHSTRTPLRLYSTVQFRKLSVTAACFVSGGPAAQDATAPRTECNVPAERRRLRSRRLHGDRGGWGL
ncbi:hypothetical protein AAFF_G00370880 [Aldrovandia affinis]|uniref:Uncharacterized protein n=1 Tax=Aldrovandia affinis TaxID=143900 RepID=A0AAD7WMI6_9TELE|nr:hypothetical protein AAFF_G00370880 [Aldrovandia affinis]